MCVWFVKESLILRQRVTAIICVLFLFFYHAASLSVDQSTAVKACSAQGCLKKGKGSPYSVTEHRVPELIPVFGSQPADDVNHKRGGMLPFLSTRPGVTLATLKRAATNFAAWWTQARWVWTVCLRLLLDSIAAAIWTQALLHLSPACYRATRLFSHAVLFSSRVWNLPLVSEISFRLPLHQACTNLSVLIHPVLQVALLSLVRSTHLSHYPSPPHSFIPGLNLPTIAFHFFTTDSCIPWLVLLGISVLYFVVFLFSTF